MITTAESAAHRVRDLLADNVALLSRYGLGDHATYLIDHHCNAVDMQPHRIGRFHRLIRSIDDVARIDGDDSVALASLSDDLAAHLIAGAGA